MPNSGIKDIAKYVGVSTALVSYVLNGRAKEKQVNKHTAERILKAAAELSYQPDPIARSLKTKKTYTIGLLVADINYRFSAGITQAVEEEAKKNNYTVIYGSSNEDKEKFSELVNVFINRRVDGLIIVPVEGSEDALRALKLSNIPFILVDRYFPLVQTCYIGLNNFRASFNATDYLLKQGHRHVVMINYKSTFFHLIERNRGFQSALESHGFAQQAYQLQEISNERQLTELDDTLGRILNGTFACDALFFATDTLAVQGLQFLNKRGLRVPKDISVLSFDESPAFALFYTPVTHSRQPLSTMGVMAVQALMKMLQDHGTSLSIELDAEIIVGGSCRE